MKRLLLFFSLLFASVCMIAQSVTFSNVRLNTNAVKDGVPGVKVTTDIRFKNLNGKIVGLVVSFYDESKNYWCTRTPINEDLTFRIGDNNFLVCAMSAVKLDEDNIITENFEFFISKKDLHLKKDYNSYYYDITAVTTDSGKRLGRTSYSFFQMSGTGNNVGFAVAQNTSSTQYDTKKLSTQESRSSVASYTGPAKSFSITDFRANFDRFINNSPAFSVKLNISASGYQGKRLVIYAYLYNEDGTRMVNKNETKYVDSEKRVYMTYDITPTSQHFSEEIYFGIPMSAIKVSPTAKDYKVGVSIKDGSQVICKKDPIRVKYLNFVVVLESNQKPNKTYTTSNPMYVRSRYGDAIFEKYYIGRTNERCAYNGWGHSREISKENGLIENAGYFKDGNLSTGFEFYYYQDNPEEVSTKYLENGICQYWIFMKQSELFKYKAKAEQLLRENNVTPLSSQLQSKVNTSYLSRNNEYTFKGVNNSKLGFNHLASRNSSSTSSSNSYSSSSSSSSSSYNSSSSSSLKTGAIFAGMAALAYAIIKGAEALDNTIENTRKANEEKRAAQRSKIEKESVYEYSNVEIVNWATFNWLSAAEAEVSIRNKNNYDVDVIIELYRGKWDEGRITYTDLHRGDRIPGVSDERSTTIRVKANSMRKVYLSSGGSGRPTAIRISSVN